MNALHDLTPAKWRKHVAKAKLKNTAVAFCSLEAELADLGRADHTTKEAAVKADLHRAEVEKHIKGICDQASPDEPTFGEHFIDRLRKRWRSSQDGVDYYQERNRLLVRLREKSVKSSTALAREGKSSVTQGKNKKIAELAKKLLEERTKPYESIRGLALDVLKNVVNNPELVPTLCTAEELREDPQLKKKLDAVQRLLSPLFKTWMTEQSSTPTQN
jgi:hypothetical protein